MVQPHPYSHHEHHVQEEIQHSFLQRAVTLCQDTDYIVRINMCDALQTIAAAVGHELTVSTVLPEIFELIGDEEVLVRVCAMRSLLKGGVQTCCKRARLCCGSPACSVPSIHRGR